MKKTIVTTALLVVCALLAGGCSKKPKITEAPLNVPEPVVEASQASVAAPVVEKETAAVVAPSAQEMMNAIYFAFDSSQLSETARETLKKNAQWLQGQGMLNIVIEGHTDERGSDIYNMALGERRAQATRDYLVTLGVSASQVRIISYGEERPAVMGQDEEAFAKNRRAEFK